MAVVLTVYLPYPCKGNLCFIAILATSQIAIRNASRVQQQFHILRIDARGTEPCRKRQIIYAQVL